MKVLILLIFIVSCQSAKVAKDTSWSYKDADKWEEVCSTGKAQSPIEILNAEKAKLSKVNFNYQKSQFAKTEEHGSLKFTPNEKNWIEVDGKRYDFLQVHFHTPSEHQVKGKSYPLEGHLVHSSSEGELMVVGVLFQLGKTNKNIDKLLQTGKINPKKLMPKKKASYRYNGSLTTPPCSEGVKWVVLTKPVSLSPEQLKAFNIAGNTNRPIRPLNDRQLFITE